MGRVHQLSDLPSMHRTTKTTIKDGVIVREPVWKDTVGNEFDRVKGKFVPRKPLSAGVINLPFLSPNESFHVQVGQTSDEAIMEAMLLVSLLLVLLFVLFLGMAIGASRRSRKSAEPRSPDAAVPERPIQVAA
jgi:hypothetical protein